MTAPMTSQEALLEQNRKDALEFCKGAFRPFVNDVRQYTDIVATLLDNATNRALLSPAQNAVTPDAVRAAIENLGYDLKLREFAPRTEIGIQNFNGRCEYLAAALSPAPSEVFKPCIGCYTAAECQKASHCFAGGVAVANPPVSSTDCAIDIPEGVYFSAEASNFYHVETKRGCGNEFYRIWKDHWRAFPQSAAAVSSKDHP